mgnify:FL=1|tara:strand:+ start:5819 stop:6433 length:615 start_codon:yes stop_codon:yes gene_type:complete
MMSVLIGCEESGTIRSRMRSIGIDCYSNDILPADDDSPYHIQGDVMDAVDSRHWDLIIMHPPCTALAVSGNAWYGKEMPKHKERLKAISWTTQLWTLARARAYYVCMENPVGVLPFKPTQYIQPWQFGHPESKKTGLWLHNLPPLKETNNVKEEHDALPKNKRMRLHYLPPSKDRARIRSKTFEGIADAIVDQWCELPLINYGA